MADDVLWRAQPGLSIGKRRLVIAGRSQDSAVLMGTLAESVGGPTPNVWLDDRSESAVGILGKRGSGKSYTLGVLLEGQCAQGQSDLRSGLAARGTLVFDPLDLFWTLNIPATATHTHPEIVRQFEAVRRSRLKEASFNVTAWIPGSEARRSDASWFQRLTLPTSALEDDDWAELLGANPVLDPMGQLISTLVRLVSDRGYTLPAGRVPPITNYSLDDLNRALDSSEVSGAHPATVNALRQRLVALSATGLFSASGTRITDIVVAGTAAVVLLQRLSESLRAVLVSVLVRQLIRDRSEATQAAKRLAATPSVQLGEERSQLEEIVRDSTPKALVALDEAQTLLSPSQGGPAKRAFIKLVKEGRNLGLSVAVASQQANSVDSQVLSQLDTLLVHQLVTEADLRVIRDNLKSGLPTSIALGRRSLDISELLRSIPPGVCLVSSTDTSADPHRSFLMRIRPRMSVHGGFEV